ncbi:MULTISPECIES: lipopolysaccharide assembly protein LapA domain-containing protein [unclassified Aureimonas]|uniref:lipopolysaccharide assembly protein LapA domain-containing protein n=1 Tax=unclassified Aureimonas TaxID=2615206 RepID=UPI0006FB84BF|nr:MULTISPECIES: LapA family protein [unclassified Aureimonas]KQT64336.1 hypothetical protein ASG62_04960 [Aureimonas sp. Leaf427]KQT81525.1 hypothetical protein ASG54_02225 [Aureimonas sp. Leaf460]
MVSRILSFLILVPLAILLVVFCVSNRGPVTVSLDPLGTMPQFTYSMPLFILMIGAVIVGLVLGGTGTWLTQAHYRRKAWKRRNEIERLKRDADDARERLRVLSEEKAKAAALAPSSSTALAAPRAA